MLRMSVSPALGYPHSTRIPAGAKTWTVWGSRGIGWEALLYRNENLLLLLVVVVVVVAAVAVAVAAVVAVVVVVLTTASYLSQIQI